MVSFSCDAKQVIIISAYVNSPLPKVGPSINLMLKTHSFMVILRRLFTWNNDLAFRIPSILHMCVIFIKPYMVSNKLPMLGLIALVPSYFKLVFIAIQLTLLFLSLGPPVILSFYWFMLMTSLSPVITLLICPPLLQNLALNLL